MRETVKEDIVRHCHPGKDILSSNRVTSVSYVPYPKGAHPPVCDVTSVKEYSAGCNLHSGCFGHICRSDRGSLLPPQSIVVRVGPISSKFLKASVLAFQGEEEKYIEALTETCLTKHGHMRSTQSTPVAGSARLVAVPQVHYARNVVCVSEVLAKSMKFECIELSHSGVKSRTSAWKRLEEGDTCILVRPPSLTTEAFQPVTIKIWEHHALGIHPEIFTEYHGDFDGDEAHLYALGDPASIREARSWIHNTSSVFDRARATYKELGITDGNETDADLAFMGLTTLSSQQLYDGDTSLLFGEETRNPAKHVHATSSRFHDSSVRSDFVSQSIRGTSDIMRQQLSQSSIGELSRLSRVAASCFTRCPVGSLMCATLNGLVELDSPRVMDKGVPSVRGVMRICSVAQQALLDAHRAGSTTMKGVDLVANLLRGSQIGRDDPDSFTLCIFQDGLQTVAGTIWSHIVDGSLVALVNPHSLSPVHIDACIGSYSPLVLRRMPIYRHRQVAIVGLEYVCRYYSVSLETSELNDLAACLSYRPEASEWPTTTRDGMVARKLSWVDTMVATDFMRQPGMANGTTYPVTASSAMYISNFSRLSRKNLPT